MSSIALDKGHENRVVANLMDRVALDGYTGTDPADRELVRQRIERKVREEDARRDLTEMLGVGG